MRKILFGINSLYIGGIQTALINLLQDLDYSKYDVTVQLFHYEEEYRKYLPSEVKIKKASFLLEIANNTMEEAKKKGLIIYFLRGFLAVVCKFIGANHLYTIMFRGMKDATVYDEAISFTNNGDVRTLYFGMNQYILSCVNAKQKSTWLHVDFEKMKLNNPYNIAEYKKFDKVIVVSEAAKKVFLKYVPDALSKAYVVYNVINHESLVKNARKPLVSSIPLVENRLKIVTVCRLDRNKNVMACLEVAQELKKSGILFQWIIVGDGSERQLIAESIVGKHLKGMVILVGYQRNPYPYIMSADIAVSTSLSESYGMSVAEAISLHTPVVAFYYPAVSEVIKNNENGFIIRQGDVKEMSRKIVSLYKSRKLAKMKANCYNLISSEDAIGQFNKVFGGGEE